MALLGAAVLVLLAVAAGIEFWARVRRYDWPDSPWRAPVRRTVAVVVFLVLGLAALVGYGVLTVSSALVAATGFETRNEEECFVEDMQIGGFVGLFLLVTARGAFGEAAGLLARKRWATGVAIAAATAVLTCLLLVALSLLVGALGSG